MSTSFVDALESGVVILENRGSVSASITLVHLGKHPNSGRTVVEKREVITLAPGRKRDLTRNYTVEELHWAYQHENLRTVIARRNIRVTTSR